MAVVGFDTLKAATRLTDAGFDEKQARELVATFAEGVGENIATKDDLALHRADLMSRMDKQDSKIDGLRKDVKAQGDQLNAKIASTSDKMTIKLGGIMIVGLSVLFTLYKMFPNSVPPS